MKASLPRIVIEGVSFPSLKSVSLSIFAKGSFGFGSLGVPSTLAHFPMVLSHPTMLFRLTCKLAPWRMMDSRTRTPAPIVTPVPIETLGPNCKEGRKTDLNAVSTCLRCEQLVEKQRGGTLTIAVGSILAVG
uniref:Uncharacterized protein n=1 Tax=Salarias fasciatus TaxID=181472 RepID=A0A672IWU9_SALFA